MTSSTKPEVHNLLPYRQRWTEPRLQVTCTENFVKYRQVFLDMRADIHTYIHTQTDRQTDTLIAISRTPPAVAPQLLRGICRAAVAKLLLASIADVQREVCDDKRSLPVTKPISYFTRMHTQDTCCIKHVKHFATVAYTPPGGLSVIYVTTKIMVRRQTSPK